MILPIFSVCLCELAGGSAGRSVHRGRRRFYVSNRSWPPLFDNPSLILIDPYSGLQLARMYLARR